MYISRLRISLLSRDGCLGNNRRRIQTIIAIGAYRFHPLSILHAKRHTTAICCTISSPSQTDESRRRETEGAVIRKACCCCCCCCVLAASVADLRTLRRHDARTQHTERRLGQAELCMHGTGRRRTPPCRMIAAHMVYSRRCPLEGRTASSVRPSVRPFRSVHPSTLCCLEINNRARHAARDMSFPTDCTGVGSAACYALP